MINPERCLWLVTVNAPFMPRSTPGGTIKPYPSYTATFDAASGEFVSVSAGPQALNVLTGFVPEH